MQDILERARASTDQEERVALYQEAQHLFHKDVPWVPLAHAQQILVINKKVKNLKLHPLMWKYFRQIWLEK